MKSHTQIHYLNYRSSVQRVIFYLRVATSPLIRSLKKVGKVRSVSLPSLWLVRSNHCILSGRCNHITPCNDDSLGLITTRFKDGVQRYYDSRVCARTHTHTLEGKSTHIKRTLSCRGSLLYVTGFCLVEGDLHICSAAVVKAFGRDRAPVCADAPCLSLVSKITVVFWICDNSND